MICIPQEADYAIHGVHKRVERQASRLSAANRKKLISALSKPIPWERCRPVKGRHKHRVMHFDLGNTLRVSFCKLNDKNFVVHVGSITDFEAFAKHYDGDRDHQFQNLKESSLMSVRDRQSEKNTKAVKQLSCRVDEVESEVYGLLAEFEGRLAKYRADLEERGKRLADVEEMNAFLVRQCDAQAAKIRLLDGEKPAGLLSAVRHFASFLTPGKNR